MRINFDEILRKLEGTANAIHVNDESIKAFLSKVKNKVEENKQLSEIWDDVKLLMDLIKDYSRGDYKDVSKNTIITITVGLLYLVNPFDLIPDFLLGGFLDDLAVIAYIIKKTSEELKKYKKWKGIELDSKSSEDNVTIEINHEPEKTNHIIILGVGDEDNKIEE